MFYVARGVCAGGGGAAGGSAPQHYTTSTTLTETTVAETSALQGPLEPTSAASRYAVNCITL